MDNNPLSILRAQVEAADDSPEDMDDLIVTAVNLARRMASDEGMEAFARAYEEERSVNADTAECVAAALSSLLTGGV